MTLTPRFPALLAVLFAVAAPAVLAPAAQADDSSQQIVVKLRGGLTADQRVDVRDDADATLEQRLAVPNVEVLNASDDGRQATIDDLNDDPRVEWAAPNRTVSAFAGEPYFSQQWGLNNTGQTVHGVTGTPDDDIDAPEAWTVRRGGGVTVGVVDSGAQLSNPDLVNQITSTWAATSLGTAEDANGHGTHVAGIIAAQQNSYGVIGVAPEAKLSILRALDANGQGTDSDIASAFAYAAQHGIRIVNASLGATGHLPATEAAIAANPSTLFVVAAGNGDSNGVGVNDDGVNAVYPCASTAPNVICVGASTPNDAVATYSNYGAASVDLFAPGNDIVSDWLNSAIYLSSGTSMASPHVAGAAALVLSANPGWTAAQVKARILDTVDPVAAFASKSVMGGRLNAAAATVDMTPPDAPTGPVAVAGDGSVTVSWAASASTDTSYYHVYRRVGAGAWTLSATTGATSALISPLANGTEVTVAVTAVDTAGQESALSTTAAATPAAGVATTPTPSATPAALPATMTPPASTTTRAASPTLGSLRLVGRPRACTRNCAPASLQFTLAATAPVSVVAAKRTCTGGRCAYRAAGSRTLRLTAGTQKVNVAPKLADAVALRAGTYRVTVQTSATTRTLNVTVAR